MRRVLIVVNECFKTESANGYCIENIIKQLRKQDVAVDVVSFGACTELFNVDKLVNVYYMSNRLFKNHSYLCEIIQGFVNRLVYHLVSPDVSFIFSNRAIKKVEELFDNNSYDLLLSSSGGFSSQFIAWKAKHRIQSVKWKALLLDPPVSINFLYKKNMPYYWFWKNIEKSIFRECDKVILERSLYQGISEIYGRRKTFLPTGIPLVVSRDLSILGNTASHHNTKRIAFFGTLWKEIRNPDYAIKLLADEMGCEIDFYGGGQTKSIIDEYTSPHISYKGSVKHDDVFTIASKYDYLLNISNLNTVQTPSKLFEYVSFGMPIINLVQDSTDITVEIVNKYGYGINILKDDERNSEKLSVFFEKNAGHLDNEIVRGIFQENTPEYTCQLILSDIS